MPTKSSKTRDLVGHVVRSQERRERGQKDAVLRGVNILGLTFFPSVPRNQAKLLVIALLALVIMLGGCVGILIAAVLLNEGIMGFPIPAEIIRRATRMAFISMFGVAVTVVGVLVHASGATEDPSARRLEV